MIFVGIDPGVSGGYAIWNNGVVEAHPMDVRGLADAISTVAVVCVEDVHSSPQMGVVSAMTFGRNLGAIEGVLIAYGMRWQKVAPKAWQAELGVVYPKGSSGFGKTGTRRKPRDKNITKAVAVKLFPDLRVTHATADALLIMEYARRQWLAERTGTKKGRG